MHILTQKSLYFYNYQVRTIWENKQSNGIIYQKPYPSENWKVFLFEPRWLCTWYFHWITLFVFSKFVLTFIVRNTLALNNSKGDVIWYCDQQPSHWSVLVVSSIISPAKPKDYLPVYFLTTANIHFLLQYLPSLHPGGIPIDFFSQSLSFPAGQGLQHFG